MEHSMVELRVVAVIPGKVGSGDVMRAALTTLAEATQGHDGCTGYELFESASAPGTFVTVESWRSQADLDAHLRTTDIATALAAADGHLAGDIAVHPLVTVPAG
jgi:quinol monooxygenase YgiN